MLPVAVDTAHERVWSPTFATAHAAVPLLRVHGISSTWGLCGDLALGSPPQRVRVVFESTDVFTWVRTPPYDHSRSSSYEADGHGVIEYGIYYSFEGFLSRDTLHFGTLALANVTFAEATRVTDLQLPPVDVVFGFVPNLQGNLVVQQLLHDDALDKPVLAFYLSKRAPPTAAKSEQLMTTASDNVEWDHVGELTIGAIGTRRFTSDIHYVKTTTSGTWVVSFDGVNVASGSAHESLLGPNDPESARASVWPSYPLILGPPEIVDKLAEAVGVDGDAIDCSSPGPDIEFHIGGRKFTLSKADYTLPSDDSDDDKSCRWAFEGATAGGWFLGQSFLQKFYTVFEFGSENGSRAPSVRFALAV